jgi:hypothetical protein
MWRKKKWIIIAVAAALILVGGVVGVAAYAQTPSPTQPDQSKTIIGRVATILHLPQAQVQAAFNQAQKDQKNDAETARLNALVAQGKLTQKQADDYKAWLQAKPNVPPGLGLPNGPAMGPNMFPNMGPRDHMGFPGFRGFPGKPGPGTPPAPSVAPKTP